MVALSSAQPIIQRKQYALDIQDLEGLLHIQIKVKDVTLFSSFYQRGTKLPNRAARGKECLSLFSDIRGVLNRGQMA